MSPSLQPNGLSIPALSTRAQLINPIRIEFVKRDTWLNLGHQMFNPIQI
jgi:hypothetical protein